MAGPQKQRRWAGSWPASWPGRLRKRGQEALRRWARRRHGPDQGTVELHQRRVYILPTRTGLIAAAVLFTMLLGALNYSNNMGFALVFLLAAVAIVSMHHCQRNLVGLQVTVTGGSPVFAGEFLECAVQVHNPGPGRRWQIGAGAYLGPAGGGPAVLDLGPGESGTLRLRLPTDSRGPVPCPAIRLATLYPLGLCQSWTWIHPELELLAYPRPAPDAVLPRARAEGPGEGAGEAARGTEEFSGLRTFVPGEPLSRVAWKSLARTGELLAKDYRSGRGNTLLDWESLPGLPPEERLSVLTRLLLDLRAAGGRYGLRLPGMEIPPGEGPDHGHQCLKALALFEAPEATDHG